MFRFLTLILITVLSYSAYSQILSKEFKELSPSIVEISTNNEPTNLKITHTGTGWLYKNQYTIVTCEHLFENKPSIVRVTFPDGKYANAKKVYLSKLVDVAVIILNSQETKKWKHHPLTISSTPPNIGDDILSIGYPLDFKNQVLTHGIVNQYHTEKDSEISFNGRFMGVDSEIRPGDSGSPAFNMKGELVGMFTWREREWSSLNFAIPEYTIQEALAKILN